MSKPQRPALRYYGGKWNLAPWIVSHFPAHENYVEPCGGAASVLLRKQPCRLETYNDIDGNVVNFFRVLRTKTDELCEAIAATPWSRAEYELALQSGTVDAVEAARRLWCSQNMSVHAGTGARSQGMRFCTRNEHKLPELKSRAQIVENLQAVAARLRNVQLECRPALEIIERYAKHDTLCYLDPPYVSKTRTQKDRYAFEWTDDDHRTAADLLVRSKATVIVSGYACPLYAEIYERRGWKRIDREASTNSGGKRVESLWLSRCQPELEEVLQVTHGGARRGAGRKSSGRVRMVVKVLASTASALRADARAYNLTPGQLLDSAYAPNAVS